MAVVKKSSNCACTKYDFKRICITVFPTPDLRGKRMSPINIDKATAVTENVKKPLDFSVGYQKLPKSCTLIDDGPTLKLTVNSADPLLLSGGRLKVPYEFQYLLFHWGPDDNSGSEHSLDGKFFPLELQLVHTRTAPQADSDEFIILAVFFKVPKINKNKCNKSFKDIMEMLLSCANKKGTPINVKPFILSSLLPTMPFPYFTYKGSLTLEPFSETATWILCSNPGSISQFQLKMFRKVGEIDNEDHENRSQFDVGERVVNFVKAKKVD